MAGRGRAARVELQELVGDVLHGLPDRRLPLLPAEAAQLVERGRRPVARRRVFLDEIQPFDGHEQLRVSGVTEVDHLADEAGVLDAREPRESPEAVVAMHDDVPDLQVTKVRQERFRRGFAARRRGARLAEEVRRREQQNARGPEEKPRARAARNDAARAGREGRNDVLGSSLMLDLVFVEKALDVLALALRLGGEENGKAVLPRARDLLHDVREPVLEGQDRLRADRDLLASRHGRGEGDERARLELGRQAVRVAREARRIGHDASGVPGLLVVEAKDVRRPAELRGDSIGIVEGENEVDCVVEDVGFRSEEKRQQLLEAVVPAREREVARHRRVVVRRAAVRKNAERRLARLTRVGRERHGRERHQGKRSRRALRIRVEGADRRDGVQVELHPDWLGEMWRDDVEEAASHREIARLRHEVRARVALVEKGLGDARGQDVVSHGQRARTLPEIVRRRQAPEKGARRDDQHVHRALREARQRPEFLAPDLQRRRDLLIGRQRRRGEKCHAILAENARRVAREGRRVALVGEHGGPFQPERRAYGLEEVRQEAGGRPRQRHASRRRSEDPRLDPPGKTLHRGRGGKRVEKRIPPPRHPVDYGRARPSAP